MILKQQLCCSYSRCFPNQVDDRVRYYNHSKRELLVAVFVLFLNQAGCHVSTNVLIHPAKEFTNIRWFHIVCMTCVTVSVKFHTSLHDAGDQTVTDSSPPSTELQGFDRQDQFPL